jgi:hypothetical protein
VSAPPTQADRDHALPVALYRAQPRFLPVVTSTFSKYGLQTKEELRAKRERAEAEREAVEKAGVEANAAAAAAIAAATAAADKASRQAEREEKKAKKKRKLDSMSKLSFAEDADDVDE